MYERNVGVFGVGGVGVKVEGVHGLIERVI